MSDVIRFLNAAQSGDLATVRSLAPQQDSLDIVDAYGASALCLAGEAGQAHVVDWLLTAGANPHIGGGPGRRAFAGPRGIQWDVLAVCRADPALVALWSAAGLPFERRDNYTMTVPRLIETEAHALHIFASSNALSPSEIESTVYMTLGQSSGTGPTTAVYRRFLSPVSERFDEAQRCSVTVGAPAGGASSDLPALRCASAMVKGPLPQLGFAHYSLRHWLEGEGIPDPAIELREIFHYFEGVVSDANITEIQIAIG